ncbi:MAG TPA: diacylglycerol kinase family protein [Solirubrobacterales bacterium]|jgi:diacylglycerol kinase family enzyme|nr:diacylglycerol kinase family protein [Solirubrobacterales bacterium]
MIFGRRKKRRLAELPLRKAGPKRRMLLVVNPYASTVSDRLKNVVIYALQSRYEIEAIDTRERNHATEIVRAALKQGDHDIVCSFGGDGTANEVINGMAGSDVPFTFLPGGMTNVIGRILGIPGDIVDATEHLLTVADNWEPRRIDLGDANGRCFVFAAGAGLDADIVRVCESRPGMKSMFGQNFYLAAAVSTFIGSYALRRARLQIRTDGIETKGVVAVAQNGRPFTYFGAREIDLAEAAGLENRSLSLTVLDRANPIDFPPIVTRLLSQKLKVSSNRHIKIVDEFVEATITPRRKNGKPIPLQVDGDYVGDFEEINFKVLPGALSVVA